MMNDKPNPFYVLKLSTEATNADIVERRMELDTIARDDEQRRLHQWATEELITHPLTRLEHELFEMPGTHYEINLDWERLLKRFKRNPVRLDIDQSSDSPIDQSAVLHYLLDSVLDLPDEDLRPALSNAPFSVQLELPLEVRDVIF